MNACPAPIGVFDSGVGGVSTLAALTAELPAEHFLYYGDNGHAPYGTKPPEEVLVYVRRVMDFLRGRQVKAVVIACNTATSVAAATLRAELELPIIGMEPALKPAHFLHKNGRILVLATPVTLRLPKYRLLEEKWGEGAQAVPCPGLMELVEREAFGEAEAYLREKLSAYDPAQIDALVLGCTHYVFLRPVLRRLLPETPILDGNAGTARQLRRVLTERGLLCPEGTGRAEFFTSGAEAEVLPVMRRLYARGLREGSL